MSKAVAIKSKSEHSLLATHFGKAPFFAILDNQSKIRIIENPYRTVPAAKGVMVAAFLSDQHVKHVYAGRFGIKVKTALDVLGLRIHYSNTKITLQEFIKTNKS